MPYTAHGHSPKPSAEELRARIPGWGEDLDRANRPSSPKEIDAETGAHWDLPEAQSAEGYRERSIEHGRLTPVFGTAQPLHGLSGRVRRFAYERFSEGRTAHWLLLVAGDRIEATGAAWRSLASSRPDDPLTESGVLGERGHHPIASRRGRVDTRHGWIDPFLVAGPWLLGAGIVVAIARRAVRRR